MQIPSYQIQNVLKVYSKQLSQGRKNSGTPENKMPPQPNDTMNLSAEGKRASIIERVASGIVDKITTIKSPESEPKELPILNENRDLQKTDAFTKRKGEKFVFNVIDENNVKTTQTLSVEDSTFILKRMNQLARETGEHNQK